MNVFTRIVTWVLFLQLGGCSIAYLQVPQQLDSRQGLVVGKSVSVSTSNPYRYPSFSAQGTSLRADAAHGNIVFGLIPGNYEMYGTLIAAPGSKAHGYIPFKVELGKVTNLGLIVVMKNPYKKEFLTRFRMDNTRELRTYLAEAHPTLYQSIKNSEFVLSPGSYTPPNKYKVIRYGIARDIYENDHQWSRYPISSVDYITGPAGTIARLTSDSNNKINFEPLDTGTLADLSNCNAISSHIVCLVSGSEYIDVINTTVSHARLPNGVVGVSIGIARDGRIVVVDNMAKIYSKGATDTNWKIYTGVVRDTPFKNDFSPADSENHYQFLNGKKGFYIFATRFKQGHTFVLYSQYGQSDYRKIPLPAGVEQVYRLGEEDNGLFIGPTFDYRSNSSIYYLANGSSKWITLDAPSPACYDMAFKGHTGKDIEIICNGNKVWESHDTGRSWKSIVLDHSLFKRGIQ